jgi:hypothetical protein
MALLTTLSSGLSHELENGENWRNFLTEPNFYPRKASNSPLGSKGELTDGKWRMAFIRRWRTKTGRLGTDRAELEL